MTLEEIARKIEELERKIDALRSVKGLESIAKTPEQERPAISYVSTCYNEAANLPELYKAILDSSEKEGLANFEILWIDNGSTDRSLEVMKALHQQDPRVRYIRLTRNFGYQGGVTCGLQHAFGEWVTLLDADLQDHPRIALEMMRKARSEKLDIVYGVRTRRKENWLRRICYSLFYRLWKATADITVPVDAGDFGVMHRRVVNVLNQLPERQRFVRGLRAWVGFRQAGYPYERAPRSSGMTKFNVRNMFNLALDGLFSYSLLPLRLTTLIGLLIVATSFTLSVIQGVFRLLAYADIMRLAVILPPGMTQINVMMVGLMGFIIICLGVLGEYVGRIYNESKDRPVFIIDQDES